MRLSRRAIVRASLLHVLISASGLPVPGADTQAWEQFLAVVKRESKRQHLDWDQDAQDAYVQRIAEIAHRLEKDSVQRVTKIREPEGQFSSIKRTADYELVGISLRAGEQRPAHNHPEMTGVLLCIGGLLRVDQFDVKGVAPGGGIILRRFSSRLLKERDISTFTSLRHNIHSVVAVEDAQILDIFTPPYTMSRMQSTQWYKLDRFATDEPEVVRGSLLNQ